MTQHASSARILSMEEWVRGIVELERQSLKTVTILLLLEGHEMHLAARFDLQPH